MIRALQTERGETKMLVRERPSRKAFEKFFRRHYSAIYRLAQLLREQMLRDGAEAIEFSSNDLRMLIDGKWRDYMRIPREVLPDLCAMIVLALPPFRETEDGLVSEVEVEHNGQPRKIRIVLKDLGLFANGDHIPVGSPREAAVPRQ